jgi:putative methionine-R-sulfoxide reductase with GAF domain
VTLLIDGVDVRIVSDDGEFLRHVELDLTKGTISQPAAARKTSCVYNVLTHPSTMSCDITKFRGED